MYDCQSTTLEQSYLQSREEGREDFEMAVTSQYNEVMFYCQGRQIAID